MKMVIECLFNIIQYYEACSSQWDSMEEGEAIMKSVLPPAGAFNHVIYQLVGA